MRTPRPIALFWIAVVVDTLALGIAWSAWKVVQTSPLALLVAIPATVVVVGSTTVAGRVLTLVSRASRRQGETRPASHSTGSSVR